jgi:hypothetical protein
MERINYKKYILVLILLLPILHAFAGDSPPPGGDPTVGGDPPLGGGVPLYDGLEFLCPMAILYGGYIVYRMFSNKQKEVMET